MLIGKLLEKADWLEALRKFLVWFPKEGSAKEELGSSPPQRKGSPSAHLFEALKCGIISLHRNLFEFHVL